MTWHVRQALCFSWWQKKSKKRLLIAWVTGYGFKAHAPLWDKVSKTPNALRLHLSHLKTWYVTSLYETTGSPTLSQGSRGRHNGVMGYSLPAKESKRKVIDAEMAKLLLESWYIDFRVLLEYEILYHIVKSLYICNTSLPLKFEYKTGTSSLHARPSLGGIRDATGEGSGGAGGRRQGSAEQSTATWHRDGQNTGTCGIKAVWIRACIW